jgi:hypothetical protein
MRTGVMVGAGSNDNLVTTFKQPQCFNPYTMQGGTLGNIANLVSFYLDLHGCSATVCFRLNHIRIKSANSMFKISLLELHPRLIPRAHRP